MIFISVNELIFVRQWNVTFNVLSSEYYVAKSAKYINRQSEGHLHN